jgi:hypothetical protein
MHARRDIDANSKHHREVGAARLGVAEAGAQRLGAERGVGLLLPCLPPPKGFIFIIKNKNKIK